MHEANGRRPGGELADRMSGFMVILNRSKLMPIAGQDDDVGDRVEGF